MDGLRVEEMVEEPCPEHAHGVLRQSPERPPRLLRPRRRRLLRPPDHPVHHLLLLLAVALVVLLHGVPDQPQQRRPRPGRRGGVEPELAQYGAAQAAEVARHGLRHERRVPGRGAGAQRRLERRRHPPQLPEVVLVPALQLQRAGGESAARKRHGLAIITRSMPRSKFHGGEGGGLCIVSTDLAEKAEELGLDAAAAANAGALAVVREARHRLVVVVATSRAGGGGGHRLAEQLLRRQQVPRTTQRGNHRRRRGATGTAAAARAAATVVFSRRGAGPEGQHDHRTSAAAAARPVPPVSLGTGAGDLLRPVVVQLAVVAATSLRVELLAGHHCQSHLAIFR